MAAALRLDAARRRCGFRAVTMAVSLAAARRHGLPVHDRAEGLPAERRSGPLQRQHRGASRASASTTWCGTRCRWPTSSRRIRTSHGSAATSAPAATAAARSTPGRICVDLKPRAERTLIGRSDHRGAAAEAGAGARHPRVHDQPAADQPRRPAGRAQPVSVHAAGHRHRRAVSVGADARRRRCASCPGIEDVSSDLQLKNPQVQVDMDRDKISALGLTVNQVENGALQRLRHAAGLADLRAEQSVPGHPAGRAGVPAGSGGAVAALRPLVEPAR